MKKKKWFLLLGVSFLLLIIYMLITNDELNTLSFMNEEQTEDTFNRSLTKERDRNEMDSEENKEQFLVIPELLEDQNTAQGKAEFQLNVQYGKKNFIGKAEADTLGYNGDYLGPLIRVRKGDEVKIHVDNQLDESTTVHWHGLEVDAEMDGGPHQVIEAQGEWNPDFTIEQQAATLWYHPHVIGSTGE